MVPRPPALLESYPISVISGVYSIYMKVDDEDRCALYQGLLQTGRAPQIDAPLTLAKDDPTKYIAQMASIAYKYIQGPVSWTGSRPSRS